MRMGMGVALIVFPFRLHDGKGVLFLDRRVIGGDVLARLAAGMPLMGAGKGDQPGDDRAEERQEDDRLIHLSPSSC
jgi:hypothetical protein